MSTFVFAAMALWTGSAVVSPPTRSEEIPTVIKKVPTPASPPETLPRKIDPVAVLKTWQIRLEWPGQSPGFFQPARSGVDIWLLTPDAITGLAASQARIYSLKESRAQALYTEILDQYYGPLENDFYGNRIGFLVTIKIADDQRHGDDISSDWDFTLQTEDGKPFQPDSVIPQDTTQTQTGNSYRLGPYIFVKSVALVFNNFDPKTEKPILTKSTRRLLLDIVGTPGKGRARFEFDTKR